MRMQQYINDYFKMDGCTKIEFRRTYTHNQSESFHKFILEAKFIVTEPNLSVESDIGVSIKHKDEELFSISISVNDFKIDENNNNIISGVSKIEGDITYDEVMLFVKHVSSKVDLSEVVELYYNEVIKQ